MNAFCASVNFDAFIVLHSSQPGKSEQKTLTQNDPVFGEQSKAVGVDFLANQDFADHVSPELRQHLLPGSFMNTLWLVSVALVRDSLPDMPDLHLGIERYRRLQILDNCLNQTPKASAATRERLDLMPLLRFNERLLLLALRVVVWPLAFLTPRWLAAFAIKAKRLMGQYYDTGEGARRLPVAPRSMTEAIAGLREVKKDQVS